MPLDRETFKQKMVEGRAKAKAAREAAKNATGVETVELPSVKPEGNGNGNGNGHHQEAETPKAETLPIMFGNGEIMNPFSHNEGYSALKVFTDIGKAEDPEALMIRSDLPDKRSDGHVLVNMITHAQDLYERFNYSRGKRRLRNVLAGYPAVNGKRIDVTLDAVIGERRQRRAEGGAFGKMNDWAKKQFQPKSQPEEM